MTEIALITGASSGIGVGIAKVLAAKVLTRHDYGHNQEHIYNLHLLLNYRHHFDQHKGSNSGSCGSKGGEAEKGSMGNIKRAGTNSKCALWVV